MNETKAAHVLLGRLEKLAEKLPPRDLNVLRDIEARRYMTTGQIRRLRFTGTGTPTSDKNVTYRTLNRLKGHGLIVPLDKRIGGVRSGSSETVWALSPTGYRLLHLDEDGQPRKRAFEPSWRFAKHTLAVAELDVNLRGITGVTVTQAQHEPACWREYGGRRLKPDYFAVTDSGAYEDHWFMEIDMNTQTPSRVVAKCWDYQDYYLSGAEQRATGIFPRVVWVVPDRKRKETIQQHIRESRELRRQDLFIVIVPEELEHLIRKGAAP